MSQVDFYILGNRVADGPLKFVSRLCQKLVGLDKTAVIHCDNESHIDKLDDLLWSYLPSSFIPHQRVDDGTSESVKNNPIVLYYGLQLKQSLIDCDVLISLTANSHPEFGQFSRIVEVVDNDPDEKQQARQRYQFYQQHNAVINTHHIAI